jgi:hypothetical protein
MALVGTSGLNLIPVNSEAFNRANGIPSLEDSLSSEPNRMTISAVDTGDTITALFNPTELKEKVTANYGRLAILGLSHKPMQYQNTENHTFDFELAFRAFARGRNMVDDNLRTRNFLLSAHYSRRGAATVAGGAPPVLLFVWPGMISMRARILSLEGSHTLFGKSGPATHSAYKVTLEAISDVRFYSEDVLDQGTLRSTSGGR